MKKKLTILLTILFIGFVGIGINDLRDNQVELQLKEVQLQDRALELNQLKLDKEQLNQKFEEAINEKDINTERVEQLEKEKLDLEERTRQLESDLQAKREREASDRQLATVGITKKASAQSPAVTVTGNKETWLRASGIPESEWWAVDSIVSRESGWKPCAYNPGRNDCNASPTSACGLAQSLPCGKQAKYGHWTDPVANLKWQYEYVTARYGGYPQAVAFWNVNHWY